MRRLCALLFVLVASLGACVMVQAAAPPPPAGTLELKAAEAAFNAIQKSLDQAIDELENRRHKQWAAEKQLTFLQTDLKAAQEAKANATVAAAAAKSLIEPALANVEKFQKNTINPLNESISQQQQQYKTVWSVEKNKVARALSALSDWPPPLIPAAQKRLSEYGLTIDAKIANMNNDKKKLANHVVTLQSLQRAHANTVKNHQFTVNRVAATDLKIKQINTKIATLQSTIIQQTQQVDAALKIANNIKRQAAQDASNLQAAVDFVMKNSNAQVAAAIKIEHEAHLAFTAKEREVVGLKREGKLLKSDDSEIDSRLKKARAELLKLTNVYDTAKDRHRTAQEQVHDLQQSVDRAQHALTEFQSQYGPIPVKPTTPGATPTPAAKL